MKRSGLRTLYWMCIRETRRLMEGPGRRNGPSRWNKMRAKKLFKEIIA